MDEEWSCGADLSADTLEAKMKWAWLDNELFAQKVRIAIQPGRLVVFIFWAFLVGICFEFVELGFWVFRNR